MAHDGRDVANEIIKRGADEHRVFTHLQIQKLVYYCHGWMLGIFEQPMITQPVSAWKHGPVIEGLYQKLKQHGREQVYPISRVRSTPYTEDENNIIDEVLRVYGGFSGGRLSNLTHAAGSPWHQTIVGSGSTISDELIKDHFRARYQEFLASQEADSRAALDGTEATTTPA